MLGFGARYFDIDTTSTTRTPDEQYTYVLLVARSRSPSARGGCCAASPRSSRWSAASSQRWRPPHHVWGFDLGVALEVRASAHVFARAAFDYQSFASSWSMIGGTSDAYSSGTVAAGATF